MVNLQELSESEREAEVQRLVIEEAQLPFNLARGPLLRITLLRLAEEEHVGLLTMHHIVSDGWSTGILIREMAVLYEAFSCGRSSPLPELPIQYADFAHWQRQWLQGEVLETQLSYWKRQLLGAPLLELPTDHPRPAVQTFRGLTPIVAAAQARGRGVKGAEPAGRDYPVHDIAGGVQDIVAPLYGSGRPHRRARRSPIVTGWRSRA